jgi:hypothetical protein
MVLPSQRIASGESLTDEYLGAMSIATLINHELPGAGGAAGHDPSAHVAPLVLIFAGGARTLEDQPMRRDLGLGYVLAWMKCRAARPVAIGYDARAQTKAEGWGAATSKPLRVPASVAHRLHARHRRGAIVCRLSLRCARKRMRAFASADRCAGGCFRRLARL